MAAIMAARNGAAVTVLEQNEKPGKKICATGNGRCNFSNLARPDDAYRGEHPEFVEDALREFSVENTIEFFKEIGIYPLNRNGYLYPRSNQAQRLIKTLGDIFVPIIPAIVASGFLMGIMEALNFMVNNGFLNIDTSGSIYTFAQLFSNTAHAFLPILIAYSGAKVFGANPYLGAVIGMIMIHPNLQNAWTVATEGVKATQKVWFGLYSIDMVGYQGHVIPVRRDFTK